MQSHHSLGQTGSHVDGVEEPDEAEYAEADGDVDKDFSDVDFLFLLFAVKHSGFVIFPWRGRSFTGHDPLPLPAHPALL